MRDGIQGLGWFVRRSSDPVALAAFYTAAIGLPELRRIETADAKTVMLRAGTFSVFELSLGGEPPSPDPAETECTPLFRSRNLADAVAKAQGAGAKIIGEETEGSLRTVTMADPLGHVYGLREADPASTQPHDVFAEHQWRNPHPTAQAMPAMSAAVQGLTCVRVRVSDPMTLARFYGDCVGLDPIGAPSSERASFYLGGSCILELRAGGTRRDPPNDRANVTDTWVLRVHDLVGMKAHFAVREVRTVNSLEVPGGWIEYYCDPEGHLFGIQERQRPQTGGSPALLPEDTAAFALWDAR
ncbi:MAG: VOC family protein [Rhodobacteraceae bacterium]|nr:VOC family protein [Paracoccaceae bacterium]